jgi:TRAP-type mannitol/chloroaromatic compound transport system permease large subunit
MYFWNTRQLASDLQEGKVTERQKMWYFFAATILTQVVIEFSGWPPKEYHAITIVAGFADVAVTAIGLFLCYQANSRCDNREFVLRFICMSWPVFWRLLAAAIPLFVFMSIMERAVLEKALGLQASISDELGKGLFAVLLTVAYYAIIRRWLIKISSGQVEAVSSGS